MNLERVLDRLESKLDAQDEKLAEFREEILERLAIIETKQAGSKDGVKLFGWILTFCVSLAALGISLGH